MVVWWRTPRGNSHVSTSPYISLPVEISSSYFGEKEKEKKKRALQSLVAGREVLHLPHCFSDAGNGRDSCVELVGSSDIAVCCCRCRCRCRCCHCSSFIVVTSVVVFHTDAFFRCRRFGRFSSPFGYTRAGSEIGRGFFQRHA